MRLNLPYNWSANRAQASAGGHRRRLVYSPTMALFSARSQHLIGIAALCSTLLTY